MVFIQFGRNVLCSLRIAACRRYLLYSADLEMFKEVGGGGVLQPLIANSFHHSARKGGLQPQNGQNAFWFNILTKGNGCNVTYFLRWSL